MPNPLTSGKPIPVWYYGAGAGVIFIAYYFYSSSKKRKAAALSAGSAAAPAMAAATTASQTPVVPAGSYGYGADAGTLNNIEQQLQNLNAAQATTQGSASSSGVVAPAPAPEPAPAPACAGPSPSSGGVPRRKLHPEVSVPPQRGQRLLVREGDAGPELRCVQPLRVAAFPGYEGAPVQLQVLRGLAPAPGGDGPETAHLSTSACFWGGRPPAWGAQPPHGPGGGALLRGRWHA